MKRRSCVILSRMEMRIITSSCNVACKKIHTHKTNEHIIVKKSCFRPDDMQHTHHAVGVEHLPAASAGCCCASLCSQVLVRTAARCFFVSPLWCGSSHTSGSLLALRRAATFPFKAAPCAPPTQTAWTCPPRDTSGFILWGDNVEA